MGRRQRRLDWYQSGPRSMEDVVRGGLIKPGDRQRIQGGPAASGSRGRRDSSVAKYTVKNKKLDFNSHEC